MAGGSVIKGSGFLILARVVGMVGGFLLFLLLTWHSKEVAGVFRTAITYLVIMDLLPLLGMHRWLAAEIAKEPLRGAAIFWTASAFAVVVASVAALVYFGVAAGGIYEPTVSTCLKVVALSTIPSALNLCVTGALVGLGFSHQSGLLGLVEMIGRASLSIVLILSGADVLWVVVVFVVARWLVAGAGLVLVRSHLRAPQQPIDRALIRTFLSQVPNLAISMIGFLVIRNIAMILLPWLRGEAETGLYAAPFQLLDLMLLVPTVLTISTNLVFVESARRSPSALRRSTNELLFLTAAYLFPAAAMSFVMAKPGIEFLFGVAYDGSVVPFQLLLICAIVMSIDQVLSLSMVTAGKYRADRICIASGAIVAVVSTGILGAPLGATGAAIGLLAGAGSVLVLRLSLMGDLLLPRAMRRVLLQQVWPALITGLVVAFVRIAFEPASHALRAVEIVLAGVAGLTCLALFHYRFGLSPRRVMRVRHFMGRGA